MKPKLLLLYGIHATYERIQMTEMHKSLNETSMPRGTEATMVKKEQVEVSTSAAAQEEEVAAAAGQSSSGGQPVQTITINGQQYQIVSPAALSASQLEGLQTVSVASSSGGGGGGSSAGASGSAGGTAAVVQFAPTSQNGQTVFIPNTVSAAGGSGGAAAQGGGTSIDKISY